MQKYTKETVVGIFVLCGLLSIAYMTVKLGKVTLLGDNAYTLKARFNNISGLRVGNAVNMLGLEIGSVTGLSLDQESQTAYVEFKVDNEIKIYDDAIASIKTEGLIGSKYLEIEAGGGGEQLNPGDLITETESPVDLQEIISKYAFGDVEKSSE